MKRIISLFLAALMVVSLCACGNNNKAKETVAKNETTKEETKATPKTTEAAKESDSNLITNGDFSDDQNGWGTYLDSGSGLLHVVKEQGVLSITNTGRKEYAVQLFYDGFKVQQGGAYRLEFDAVCNEDRDAKVRIQINGGDYHAYMEETYKLTTKVTHYSYDFKMTEASDQAPRLCFNCGTISGDAMKDQEITFDNVSLTLVDDSGVVKDDQEKVMKNINLNQVGYRPDDKKKVIFNTTDDSQVMDSSYDVVDESGNVVFTGKITGKAANVSAGETDYYGDFSKVTKEGTYKIVTKNYGESYEFVISKTVYDNAFDDIVHMLYLQRCGCEINDQNGGKYAHPVCHSGKALVYGTKKEVDVSGGWHDAGDYGRYVCAGAKTVADILLAYNDNSKAFKDKSNIPESGNGIPDILDEARYELEWMLKMQDGATGGVYHKVTCKNFPGEVSPEKETDQLVLAPISLTATGDFSAVMAMAYETYLDIDAAFAKQCLKASEYAYDYLMNHKDGAGFKNPDDIVTGEYPDSNNTDERFWAACQLYKATGSKVYRSVAEEYIASNDFEGLGWADMGTYGKLAYLETTNTTDKACRKKILDEILTKAVILKGIASLDGYGISLGTDYTWGSNMTVTNNAMMLILANKFSKDESYLQSAFDHLNYIFGANANSICFVTGYGTVSPQHTHHRPSMAVGASMPGMLVGGPDSNLEDPYAKNVLADSPAAKCYADNAQSYSCNEVTIYWNSSLIYVMSQLVK